MKILWSVLGIMSLLLVAVDGYAFRCRVTTTPVSFGGYDVFSSFPLDTTGRVSVSCNNPEKKRMPVAISINRGGASSFNPRQMRQVGGSDRMDYYLFIDASRTTLWGDGSGGSSTYTGMIDRTSPLNVPIYGRVPARQNLRGGTYRDSLVVTIDW